MPTSSNARSSTTPISVHGPDHPGWPVAFYVLLEEAMIVQDIPSGRACQVGKLVILLRAHAASLRRDRGRSECGVRLRH
jgi:hypothetical protein